MTYRHDFFFNRKSIALLKLGFFNRHRIDIESICLQDVSPELLSRSDMNWSRFRLIHVHSGIEKKTPIFFLTHDDHDGDDDFKAEQNVIKCTHSHTS